MRPRQLSARTLLIGMLLGACDDRPAHFTRVHQALTSLPEDDRRRLGVLADWPTGPHQLTYRQLEYTFTLVARALSKPTPDGAPSEPLSEVLDALLEASVGVLGAPPCSSYAVDWTDHETWSRPPPKPPAQPDPQPPAEPDPKPAAGDSDHDRQRPSCADPEASWGHRKSNRPGATDELFYGYYLQVATIVKDDNGPEVPELTRRLHLSACHVDPPQALVPVLQRMTASGIEIADVLADSGYAYRKPEHWALPVRRLGANLIVDLHPNDRGPHGTHMGATINNGNLYCPATPTTLLQLGPLAPAATAQQIATHDTQTDELARYKLGRLTRDDPDGYHRVACPATTTKLRCPLRPASLTLPHTRPEILTPPEHPPACCRQQTLTVPSTINAKTAQKHDYPSAAHRASYRRRTAAERAYATTKDPATTNINNGWCRIMGLTANALFAATAHIARNLRVADAFNARQADNDRRHAAGLPPKTRRRRRTTAHDLIGAANAP